jgi:hypothetical protein
MNPSTIINEIRSKNTGISPKIDDLEQNNTRLERYIADADQNWHDDVKERFFGSSITTVRQAHAAQISAMSHIQQAFERGESAIFSLI